MPRKPKVEKQSITVVVNGAPVGVILHPPTATRKSWYAYWPGQVASKSTGQRQLADAIVVAEAMVKTGGKKPTVADALLSDEEFEAVQRVHFERRQDPHAQARAKKSLDDCLTAITAFRDISGLRPIAKATAADCASFQRSALALPKNWRSKHPKSRAEVECLSANTVLKWSRSLQAAFERVNCTAGRTCVRGVIDETKLLSSNPWTQFVWIEGTKAPLRQFDGDELLSFLDSLQGQWPEVKVAPLVAKVFLWSACRKREVAGLTWKGLRTVGDEFHFQVVGKWGVKRWFRLPPSIHAELCNQRTSSAFHFAAYSNQIRLTHAKNRGCLRKIRDEFNPENFADWFYRRVKEWSKTQAKGQAFVHHFRKTGLQHARRGEDINRLVAADARVGESVMMTSYVEETDEELRAKSNRTYRRIAASLPVEVVRRYGYVEDNRSDLERRLREAMDAKDWPLLATLSSRLA